jgi:hypothetical protein
VGLWDRAAAPGGLCYKHTARSIITAETKSGLPLNVYILYIYIYYIYDDDDDDDVKFSLQSFLRCVAAWLSAKWHKPLSTVTSWVRVRVQFAAIKAVALRIRGSKRKWRSSGFEDGKGIAALFQKLAVYSVLFCSFFFSFLFFSFLVMYGFEGFFLFICFWLDIH